MERLTRTRREDFSTSENIRTVEQAVEFFHERYFSTLESQIQRVIEWEQKSGADEKIIRTKVHLLEENLKDEREAGYILVRKFFELIKQLKETHRSDPIIFLWDAHTVTKHPIIPALIDFQKELYAPHELEDDIRHGVLFRKHIHPDNARDEIVEDHPALVGRIDPRYIYTLASPEKKDHTTYQDFYIETTPKGVTHRRRLEKQNAGCIDLLVSLREKGKQLVVVDDSDILQTASTSTGEKHLQPQEAVIIPSVIFNFRNTAQVVERVDIEKSKLQQAREHIEELLVEGKFKGDIHSLEPEEREEVLRLRHEIRQLLKSIIAEVQFFVPTTQEEAEQIVEKKVGEQFLTEAQRLRTELEEYMGIDQEVIGPIETFYYDPQAQPNRRFRGLQQAERGGMKAEVRIIGQWIDRQLHGFFDSFPKPMEKEDQKKHDRLVEAGTKYFHRVIRTAVRDMQKTEHPRLQRYAVATTQPHSAEYRAFFDDVGRTMAVAQDTLAHVMDRLHIDSEKDQGVLPDIINAIPVSYGIDIKRRLDLRLDALQDIFGSQELLHQYIRKHPELLHIRVHRIETNFATLIQLVKGDEQLARSLCLEAPIGILGTRPAELQKRFALLQEFVSNTTDIKKLLQEQRGVIFKSLPKTIHTLTDIFENKERVQGIIRRCPTLLQISPEFLLERVNGWAEICGGRDMAIPVLENKPFLLLLSVSKLQQRYQKIFSIIERRKDIKNPILFIRENPELLFLRGRVTSAIDDIEAGQYQVLESIQDIFMQQDISVESQQKKEDMVVSIWKSAEPILRQYMKPQAVRTLRGYVLSNGYLHDPDLESALNEVRRKSVTVAAFYPVEIALANDPYITVHALREELDPSEVLILKEYVQRKRRFEDPEVQEIVERLEEDPEIALFITLLQSQVE